MKIERIIGIQNCFVGISKTIGGLLYSTGHTSREQYNRNGQARALTVRRRSRGQRFYIFSRSNGPNVTFCYFHTRFMLNCFISRSHFEIQTLVTLITLFDYNFNFTEIRIMIVTLIEVILFYLKRVLLLS